MDRRKVLKGLGAGAVAAGLAACGQDGDCVAGDGGGKTYQWNMVTTWPPKFPGAGTGAAKLAERIERASNGRIKIQVYAAGELVPAFEAFDAVSGGTVQMAHGASYYWKGKVPASPFFAAVPFGMDLQEMNAWLYYGGGWDMWRELYAPFDIVPVPAGNTGVQMAGWFNKEINTIDDLKGLKMRIPGLGAEVLRMAGGTPENMPGSEIFTSLQTGRIDAAEWIGPYNDLSLGLFKTAKYYYYPGWHEPGSTLEAMINKKVYDELPADLQEIVLLACSAANDDMLAEYNAGNARALKILAEEHDVVPRRLPEPVLAHLRELSQQLLEKMAAENDAVASVYSSYRDFQDSISKWSTIGNQAYLDARTSSA